MMAHCESHLAWETQLDLACLHTVSKWLSRSTRRSSRKQQLHGCSRRCSEIAVSDPLQTQNHDVACCHAALTCKLIYTFGVTVTDTETTAERAQRREIRAQKGAQKKKGRSEHT